MKSDNDLISASLEGGRLWRHFIMRPQGATTL